MKKPGAGRNGFAQPEGLFAVIITLVIVWGHVHFWRHAGGFWRDEVNSINVASSHSLPAMAHDSFPVLTPLLLHGWLSLGGGNSDLALRTFGLLVGLAIPIVLWLAAWQTRRTFPLIGLTLVGMNTTLIVFGDSIRAYGLGSLLMASAVAVACLHLQRPTWRRAAWLAISFTLSVQALYHNAVLVAAVCVGGWAVCRRRKTWLPAWQILGAGIIAALSLLPYVPLVRAGRETAIVLRTGIDWSHLRERFVNVLGFPTAAYLYVWIALVLVVIVFAVVAVRRRKEMEPAADETDISLFAAATLAAGIVFFSLFLLLASLPSQSWYLLPFLALAAVCLDLAWPRLPGIGRAIFLGCAALTALLSTLSLARDLDYHMTNVDLWGKKLSTEAAPEDYVVVVPWFCGLSFERYFKASTPWDTVPPLADHATHRYDLVRAQLQDTNAMAPVFEKMDRALQSGHRVWVLAMYGLMDVPAPGTAAPASPPPAPLASTGWLDTPYVLAWDSQVGHHLGDHSRQFKRMDNPTAGESFAEGMELFMAEGWRPAAP